MTKRKNLGLPDLDPEEEKVPPRLRTDKTKDEDGRYANSFDFRGVVIEEVDKALENKRKEVDEIAKQSSVAEKRDGVNVPFIDPGGNSWDFNLKGFPSVTNASMTRDKKTDEVNHPAHYTKAYIECIDAIRAALGDDELFLAYCEGNVIKYLWRHRSKGGLTDLEKAKWYLDVMVSIKSDAHARKKTNVDKIAKIYGAKADTDGEND